MGCHKAVMSLRLGPKSLEQNVEQSSKGCDGLSQGSDELYQS